MSGIAPAAIATYRTAITHIPNDTITRADVLTGALLIGREERLLVYYAPLDSITATARIVLVGLTPGWRQVQIAYQDFRRKKHDGTTDDHAMQAAKGDAAFAGMRKRPCGRLDDLGVGEWLGIPSTTILFADHRHLVHTASVIRYPVFVDPERKNYSGHGPEPADSPLLMSIVREVLLPELAALSGALIVPMGVAVNATLLAAGVSPARCLYGFPHPSGANGHAPTAFAVARTQMRAVVSARPRSE